MRRPAAALLGTAVLAASAAPPTAYADGGEEIGLSRDGVTWSASLTQPLFDPRVRWVPGDVRTARFYVRNQAGDAGDLSLVLERAEQDALLGTGHLTVAARAGSGRFTTVDRGGRRQLVDRDDLRADRPLRVDVRVALDADAPNAAMVLGTDLDLTVTLRDTAATLPATGGVPGPEGLGGPGGLGGSDGSDGPGAASGPGGVLPATGSAVPPWLPPLALGLLGTGTFLLVRRRRHDDLEPILTSSPQSS